MLTLGRFTITAKHKLDSSSHHNRFYITEIPISYKKIVEAIIVVSKPLNIKMEISKDSKTLSIELISEYIKVEYMLKQIMLTTIGDTVTKEFKSFLDMLSSICVSIDSCEINQQMLKLSIDGDPCPR